MAENAVFLGTGHFKGQPGIDGVVLGVDHEGAHPVDRDPAVAGFPVVQFLFENIGHICRRFPDGQLAHDHHALTAVAGGGHDQHTIAVLRQVFRQRKDGTLGLGFQCLLKGGFRADLIQPPAFLIVIGNGEGGEQLNILIPVRR